MIPASPPSRRLLCAALAAAEAGPDLPPEAIAAAHAEGVHALLWLQLTGGSDAVPEAMMREHRAWILRMRHATAQILDAMARAGIPAICLRGQALAGLYGDRTGLRPQSDIDLLVAEEQLLAAKQVAWDLGFRADALYRHHYARGDVQIDFHFEPLGIERIQAWAELTPLRSADLFDAARQGEVAGTTALVVDTRLLLPYLCFHAMKHSFERLIWLVDIAELCRQAEAEGRWPGIEQGIVDYGLQRPCYFALAYVKAALAAPVPETLLASIRPNMGWAERRLFSRHMQHEIIPFLAEREFARMMPGLRRRLAFWRETIYPRYEIRRQIAESGCVKCNFTRKRLHLLLRALRGMFSESWRMLAAWR